MTCSAELGLTSELREILNDLKVTKQQVIFSKKNIPSKKPRQETLQLYDL